MTNLILPVENRDHMRGRKNAAVTLLEYGDYECPHCGRAFGIVNLIERELGDDLLFAFRNFPLSQVHPHALHAAFAAEAAALQHKFWDMHAMLFEHQDMLDDEHLIGYAERLGLDEGQFIRDMNSTAVQQRVREDFLTGVRSGVNGTPTFFINGRRYDGSYEHDALLAALERERSAAV